MIGAMKVPLAGAMLLGVLVLLQPSWFQSLLRLIPSEKVRSFAGHVITSATAYSDRRGYMLFALVLAVVGQVTTTLMYFCNAMSIAAEGVHTSEVLFASAVMTLGTFVAPSASGEGVRAVHQARGEIGLGPVEGRSGRERCAGDSGAGGEEGGEENGAEFHGETGDGGAATPEDRSGSEARAKFRSRPMRGACVFLPPLCFR
jgi:hypothetical protein